MNRQQSVGGLAIAALAVLLLAVLPALTAQSQDKAEAALKAAMDKEVVDGNLKAAIEQYKKLAEGANKPVAARALVRLGECYEKQGNADARKTYEQVLSRFGDQKDAVAQAQARLVALGGGQTGQMTNKLVWAGGKADPEGKVSPDGRCISFPDWSTSNLGLHDLVTGADRLLTNSGKMIPGVKGGYEYAEVSVISRDGKQVAYAWYDDTIGRYGLRIANLNGDPNPRHVFDRADIQWISPQDWSPDGKWIVARLSAKERNSKMGQIGLIAVQDGSLRVLNVVGSPDGIHFSADGQYLAYDRLRSDTSSPRHLFLLSIDGSREIPVAAGPTQEKMVGWSPDGKYLLLSSDRTGSIGLWALPVANGAPQGQPSLVYENFGQGYPMGLTAAGALYYYVGGTRTLPRIQVATFDLSTGKILSAPAGVAEEGVLDSENSPTWSADGKFLAYRSQRTGTGASIKIWSAETGRVVRELRPKVEMGFSYLRWAPDSHSFAVVGPAKQISRVDAETGEVSVLAMPKTPVASPASWSPDGKKLYYRSGGAQSQERAFIELDIASGSEREVIRGSRLAWLNVSPDGRYIVTSSDDPSTNSRTLLVVPVTGGGPREVMRVPSELAPAELGDVAKGQQLRVLSWGPSGRSLLVRKLSSNRSLPEELWQVPLDGGELRRLDVRLDLGVSLNPNQAGITMSPDGRHMALDLDMGSQQSATPPQVFALENFLPAAKGAPAAK